MSTHVGRSMIDKCSMLSFRLTFYVSILIPPLSSLFDGMPPTIVYRPDDLTSHDCMIYWSLYCIDSWCPTVAHPRVLKIRAICSPIPLLRQNLEDPQRAEQVVDGLESTVDSDEVYVLRDREEDDARNKRRGRKRVLMKQRAMGELGEMRKGRQSPATDKEASEYNHASPYLSSCQLLVELVWKTCYFMVE